MKAMRIAELCRMYPAYTPETARHAPAWVWRDMEIVKMLAAQPGQ